MMEWNPIATAPKAEWVLVWGPDMLVQSAAYTDIPWHKSEAGWWNGGYRADTGLRTILKPTHWMPLPEPPES